MTGTGRRLSAEATRAARAARRGAELALNGSRRVGRMVSDRVREERLAPSFHPHPGDRFTAVVYFAADRYSLYQMEQWVWSFERLAERLREETGEAEPLGVLCRSARIATAVAEMTWLPVRFSRLAVGMGEFMTRPSVRMVFYVNQATKNFQSLRFPRPVHVHLSHGESEKSSMISNQLKAYDAVFTAGQAARERISRTLFGFSEDRMHDVGRPQLDRPVTVPAEWTDIEGDADSPVVFYAPTWEGDSPAMAYGTLAESGEAIVGALLAAGARVIYRPHPRTGVVRAEFKEAHHRITAMLADAPGSLVDQTRDVGWQFEVADACVAEMSSVAFDWLAMGKPLAMVRPTEPAAEVQADGLFSRVPSVRADDPGVAETIVRELLLEPHSEGLVETVAYYFGEARAGEQQRRFEDAALRLIASRDEALRARGEQGTAGQN